jgi:DNA-binding transcriptional LysR family regulator
MLSHRRLLFTGTRIGCAGNLRPIDSFSRCSCRIGINDTMDLKHLRAFVAVAENGTVSRAAVRLNTAQPALSRQIIDLEQELGIALFDRVGRRLRLTGEGEQLLGNCRQLLGFATSLVEQAHELRRGDSGVLKVTASPQMIDNVFSGFLHRYAECYPNVLVKLIEGIGANVLAFIERGDAMLGTVGHEAIPRDNDHFGKRLLLSVTFSAAYHQPYNLGAGISIDVRRLEPYPLLLLNPSFVLRKTFDAACRLAEVRPNVHFECSSPHTLLSLAEAGHGVAIVPSNVLLHRYKLMALPIVSQGRPLHEPLSIFWDGRRALPRYASDFCELLEGYIREVIPVAPAGSRSVVEPA